jgi:hypothetical protein
MEVILNEKLRDLRPRLSTSFWTSMENAWTSPSRREAIEFPVLV